MRRGPISIGVHRHLTIRSSRPRVVASAVCFALRLHTSAAPPRGGLTQALGLTDNSSEDLVQKYILYMSRIGTIGLDTAVNLSLEINLGHAPIRLSDFNGGTASSYDGYSTHTEIYSIALTSYDQRRIYLRTSEGYEIELAPQFNRDLNPPDPTNQLIEVPLRLGQELSGYSVRNSNWGLR